MDNFEANARGPHGGGPSGDSNPERAARLDQSGVFSARFSESPGVTWRITRIDGLANKLGFSQSAPRTCWKASQLVERVFASLNYLLQLQIHGRRHFS